MSQLAEQDDEINLGELFAAVKHGWLVVCFTTLISIILSGYYAFFVAVPEYEASTRFELLNGDQGGSALGQAAGIAALVGIGLPTAATEAEALQDRILSRPFVGKIYEKAGFGTDPIFNGTLAEPDFAKRMRNLIFGEPEQQEPTETSYNVMAIDSLKGRIAIIIGENGIIQLKITHPNGSRAADIANVIVEQSLQDIFERERLDNRNSLNYFADELLQVRSDLDEANAAVRDYAIGNSLQSAEELARTSSRLSQVRRDIENLDLSITALNQMKRPGFNGTEFARSYPISTSLSFRRLLNIGSNPVEWVQPSNEVIDASVERIEIQRASLENSLNSLQSLARSSGEQALELAALRREVEVRQAIYESVITQFEAQALFSGYERASGRIVERAIAPTSPSAPSKRTIVATGLIIGLIVGATLTLFFALRAGRLFSRSAIEEAFGLNDVRYISKSQLVKNTRQQLSPKQRITMQELFVSFPEAANIQLICSVGKYNAGDKLALGLAKTASTVGDRSVILDLANSNLFKNLSASETTNNKFRFSSLESGVDVCSHDDPNDFLKLETAKKQLAHLSDNYDRVYILLPSPEMGTATARVVAKCVDSALLVAERARSTRPNIQAIKSIFAKSEVFDPLLVIV